LSLPELTIDMDGVLCRPICWFNLVISRDVRHPLDLRERPLPRFGPNRATFHRRLMDSRVGHALRYEWRPPLRHVPEGLMALATVRRLILLSGRPETSRPATERWLERHHLRDYFSEVVLNDRGLPNASFKYVVTQERGAMEHVDDDGRVAYFLAREAKRTVFLISWAGNAGLPYPERVYRVRSLLDAAERIHTLSR
jgi:FMN phosphatase YigB (HAD superfamily)